MVNAFRLAATGLLVALFVSASASAAVPLTPCSDAPKAMCGTVRVALDRSNPALGTISIFFRLVPHTGSKPALQPIFASEGGPGFSVTQNFSWHAYTDSVFAPLRARHDLVFVDQRGVGLSAAIDCESIQHGVTGYPFSAFARCASHLGHAANDYGSGDVALDTDAVRATLGVDKFDYYGDSYSSADVQAYAARFPQHLSAAVLDSPIKLRGLDDLSRSTPAAMARAVTLVCRRSASCSRDHHHAGKDVVWLARRLRRHPVDGIGIDSVGGRHRLHVTEAFLAWHMLSNSGGPVVVAAEITAAASSLRAGDAVPLLRLAADSVGPLIPPFVGDSSSAPTAFSGGDNVARFCSDVTVPWDKAASGSVRRKQFRTARAGLAGNTFAPFSVGAWLAPQPAGPIGPDPCIVWPAPGPNVPAPVPPRPAFPPIPVLVLSGDLDTTVPSADSRQVAMQFPKSTFIELADSGHHTAFSSRSSCSIAIIQHFLASLRAGDKGCAASTAFVFPAVGRFPLSADRARPARSASTARDRSTILDRKVAAVAAATLKDAFGHAFLTSSNGVGLRGGTFRATFGNTAVALKLHQLRFTTDVAISGHATLPFSNNVIKATLTVRGPHRETGTLNITGAWLQAGARSLTVGGTLGGRRVALAVPAT